jgi:hypothetical protein
MAPAHIPYFAMGDPARWYAAVDGWQTTGLSEYGRRRASEILGELCDCSKDDAAFAPRVAHAAEYFSQMAKRAQATPEHRGT